LRLCDKLLFGRENLERKRFFTPIFRKKRKEKKRIEECKNWKLYNKDTNVK
jgi:hypothetical protein